MSKIFQISW